MICHPKLGILEPLPLVTICHQSELPSHPLVTVINDEKIFSKSGLRINIEPLH